MARGHIIINWFTSKLAGSPFLVNRLLLLLSDALDALEPGVASRLAAHWVCDHRCTGGDHGDYERCYGECLEEALGELERLLGVRLREDRG